MRKELGLIYIALGKLLTRYKGLEIFIIGKDIEGLLGIFEF